MVKEIAIKLKYKGRKYTKLQGKNDISLQIRVIRMKLFLAKAFS